MHAVRRQWRRMKRWRTTSLTSCCEPRCERRHLRRHHGTLWRARRDGHAGRAGLLQHRLDSAERRAHASRERSVDSIADAATLNNYDPGPEFAQRASSAAERLWMRPKPATKRASRGVIAQNEKSASSKLIACSGKRSSQADFSAAKSAA